MSNTSQFRIVHYHFDWKIVFEKEVISGNARLSLKRIDQKAETLHLDVLKIDIFSITINGEEVAYEIKPFAAFGSDLIIDAPLRFGNEFELLINYEAGTGKALCWLNPEQTAGKKHPYLFTQGQVDAK